MKSDNTKKTNEISYSVYDSVTYREFVRLCLGKGSPTKRSGSVKNLAEYLKCHSTYISQVISEKSHLSNEQAISFCSYFRLNEEETEFFLNLVNRDRAGNAETRLHFERMIQRQLEERTNLKKRWKTTNTLELEPGLQYYETWIPQAVHILSQIDCYQNAENVASALKVDRRKIFDILKMLDTIGLIKFQDNKIKPIVDSIHLDKKSPLHAKFLANWRLKAIEDLSYGRDPNGINYSSVVSLSEAAQQKIKTIIIRHLEEARNLIVNSKSEKLCVYNLDFYSITSSEQLKNGRFARVNGGK